MSSHRDIVIFFVAGTLLFMLFAFFIVYFFLIQKRIQYAHKLEKHRLAFESENKILRVRIEEQEYAFNKMSRELHDNIKSKLGTSQMTLYRIIEMPLSQKQALLADRLDKILNEVIGDVQNMGRSLSGEFVQNIGLINAISERLENVRASKRINCSIEVQGHPFYVDPDTELNIFRIAQEAIQNTVKYSQACSLSIVLCYRQPIFTMTVKDDGAGFDKNRLSLIKGQGIANMIHRANDIGGTLEIQSAPTKGCSITLTLKMEDDE